MKGIYDLGNVKTTDYYEIKSIENPDILPMYFPRNEYEINYSDEICGRFSVPGVHTLIPLFIPQSDMANIDMEMDTGTPRRGLTSLKYNISGYYDVFVDGVTKVYYQVKNNAYPNIVPMYFPRDEYAVNEVEIECDKFTKPGEDDLIPLFVPSEDMDDFLITESGKASRSLHGGRKQKKRSVSRRKRKRRSTRRTRRT